MQIGQRSLVIQPRDFGHKALDKPEHALGAIDGVADKAPHERTSPALVAAQPNIYAKLAELLAEDVKEAAMTLDTANAIIKPTQVVIEAFDAALSDVSNRLIQDVAARAAGGAAPLFVARGSRLQSC